MTDTEFKPWAEPGIDTLKRLDLFADFWLKHAAISKDYFISQVSAIINIGIMESLKWSDADQPLIEDSYILEALPTHSGTFDRYLDALHMVKAKCSRGALVALVNYLLYSRDQARDSFRTLDEQQRKWAFDAEDKQAELERQLKVANDALSKLSPKWKRASEEVPRLGMGLCWVVETLGETPTEAFYDERNSMWLEKDTQGVINALYWMFVSDTIPEPPKE